MFEISATELMVIAVVAIVVIGPKDLPDMLRGLGRIVRKMRMMAGDFQRQVDQAGFEDVRKGFEEVRSLTSPSGVIARSITSALEESDSKSVSTQKAVAPAASEPEKAPEAIVAPEAATASGSEPAPHAAADTNHDSAASDEASVTTIARVSVARDDDSAEPALQSVAPLDAASAPLAGPLPLDEPAAVAASEPAAATSGPAPSSQDPVVPAAKPGDV